MLRTEEQEFAKSTFRVDHVWIPPSDAALRFAGRFRFSEARALWQELTRHELRALAAKQLTLDISAVEDMDGSAMALLADFRTRMQQSGVRAEFVGASPRVQSLVELYGGEGRVTQKKRKRARGMFDQIGGATMELLRELQLVLAFVGQMVVSAGRVARAPLLANFRDIPPQLERAGADGVPIVVLLNFLVGVVMAYQASAQLKQFGANILVADLIGISVTRELGPLMTAVVATGRSGAAFAAELGTMRVNEEIDALRTMGFGPMRYLVLPRTLALMIAMPLLTICADLVGILGGLLVAVGNLDLSAIAYLNELDKAVKPSDVTTGLVKSVVFGLTIALVACQQGLATAGGAEGVGRRTTSAVVTTLFFLILLDAVFTVFFRALGV